MQYRGLTNRGILAFGDAVFSSTPRLYEMTPEEAETILSLCGDRVTLEPLEPEPAPGKRRTTRTRKTSASRPRATRSTTVARTN